MDRNPHQESDQTFQVLVVGGGLAGLSAACEMADRGLAVTLLEKRPYLGGRTYSFRDKNANVHIDNGQHIFMKCCRYYVDFLRRLGVYESKTWVQNRLSVPVFSAEGKASFISRMPIPAPLQVAQSFFAYKHLTLTDKLRVLRIGATLFLLSEEKRKALDDLSFYDWLKAHDQSEQAIDNFWNLIILPTLNDHCRDVSAAQAIMVFREGFMKTSDGIDIGFPSVGLSFLLTEEARLYIQSRGGSIVPSASLSRLEGDLAGIVEAVTHGGVSFKADAYVLAVPQNKVLAMLPKEIGDVAIFRRIDQLAMSPIVNLHLWLDRAVMDEPFAAYLDSQIQWVFNRNMISSFPTSEAVPNSQHLVVSVSGAHKYIDMSKETLYGLLLDDLRARIPGARQAKVLHHTIVRERFATFTAAPGAAINRPPARTPIPNLFLAGDWTDTGWPSTMEGAVRSGVFAAQAVLEGPARGRDAG